MQTPVWVTVLVAVAGGLVGAILTLLGVIITQRVTRRRDVEQDERERSRANRELLLQALELERSEDATAKQQGRALLLGLSRTTLSVEDAALVRAQVTRPAIQATLEEARAVQARTGEPPRFVVGDPVQREGGSSD